MMHNKLEKLNPTELLVLQKHVKLGKTHLCQQLTNEEAEQLFKFGTVTQKIEEKIAADSSEFMGNLSRFINTVFTSILGAWLGLTGLMKFKLDSVPLFLSLLGLCILIGGTIGFLDFQFTKRSVKRAIDNQKTKSMETNILKVLNDKREAEIQEKVENLEQLLNKMGIEKTELADLPAHPFNGNELCLKWMNQISDPGEPLSSYLAEMKTLLEKRILEDQKKEKEKLSKIIHKLAHHSVQSKLPSSSWTWGNLRVLIISITPVILGTFSSLFVYLGGAVRLADEMSQDRLFKFLSQPSVKYAEVGLALCITSYFAFSFFQMKRKVFTRDQELTKSNALLANEETKLDLLDDRLLKIKAIEDIMKPISFLYLGSNYKATLSK